MRKIRRIHTADTVRRDGSIDKDEQMNDAINDTAEAATTRPSLLRGLWLALALSLVFLAVSAVQSAATFLSRISGSMMTAATGADLVRPGGS